MSIKEQKAAAKSHLQSIGMSRHGWLHPELQVALHTARLKGKITDKNLQALGELFKKTNVEQMKPHLVKATAIAKRSSGKEAFDHLMHTANSVISPSLEAKKLIIKYNNLHPHLKSNVRELLLAREKRIDAVRLLSIAVTGQVGSLLALQALKAPDRVVEGLTAGTLFPAAALVGQYVAGSPLVHEATSNISEKAKEIGFLDAQKTISVTHVRETHPFLVVDGHGNVHLIPKTKFQNALAKAQRTFLKHVVPGRYRAQL